MIEANAPIPEEPILFNKASSCISGPHDPVVLPRESEKSGWEVERDSKIVQGMTQMGRRTCICLITTGSPNTNLSASSLISRDPTQDHVSMTGG